LWLLLGGVPQKRKNFPSEEIFAPSLRSLSFAAGRDKRRQRIRARSRKLGFAPPHLRSSTNS